MAYTAAQLATLVAKHLGILQSGQTINSNDSTDIVAAYNSVYLELQALKAVTWGPDDSIPTDYAFPVRDIVTFRVAKDFGAQPDLNEYLMAMRQLKAIQSVEDPGEPARATYY